MKNVFILLVIITSTFCGQTPEEFPKSKIPYNPEKYICYRIDASINIDGKLDESEWGKADWSKDFVDIEGDLKPKPYYTTQFKMLWDDEYLYFGAKLYENHIWANLTQRDAVIFYDNDFEIFIDPDGDTHKYYEFEINAFNTQWDLLISKPYRDDNNVALNGWDIHGLKTAVDIQGSINDPSDEDNYWTVEVAYPWKALSEYAGVSSPPKNNDQWRINFSRVEWETEVIDGKYVKKINPNTNRPYPENNWVWSPQGIINMHAPETWGYVQFSNTTVGSGKEEFKESELERVKWEMRKVYYAQQDYIMNNGVYSNKFELLGLTENMNFESYVWPPQINTTTTQFEAIIKSKDGQSRIIIYQDGLIKELNKNEEM